MTVGIVESIYHVHLQFSDLELAQWLRDTTFHCAEQEAGVMEMGTLL